MVDPLRHYFGGPDTPDNRNYIVGAPEIVSEAPQECPNCKCAKTFLIRVKLKGQPEVKAMLKADEATGVYFGCAACPWASPMKMVAGG